MVTVLTDTSAVLYDLEAGTRDLIQTLAGQNFPGRIVRDEGMSVLVALAGGLQIRFPTGTVKERG